MSTEILKSGFIVRKLSYIIVYVSNCWTLAARESVLIVPVRGNIRIIAIKEKPLWLFFVVWDSSVLLTFSSIYGRIVVLICF